MGVWELGPGRLLVAGGFSDLALHHHPAVQVTVGGRGPLTVTWDGEHEDVGRLVVIASGARHAVRSDSESGALTLYLGLQTPEGVALSTLSRNHGQRQGIWIVEDGHDLAEATVIIRIGTGSKIRGVSLPALAAVAEVKRPQAA